MRSIIVKKAQKMDLINYLMNSFKSLNKSSIYKALRNKDIRINGNKINKNIILNPLDQLDIYITDNILFNLPKKIDVIYEDENILVVYKPQGILSNNEEGFSSTEVDEPTFDDLVKRTYTNAIICHRLDRNTAGLLIFAKNANSYNELSKAFKEGNINKNYIAYVSGTNFSKEYEKLEKYILKDEKTSYCKIFDKNIKGSKKIVTEYSLIYKNTKKDYSLLKVTIHTGKTHQIRAQLKDIGHPIIGDQKYGKININKKFKIYKQLLFATCYKFNFDKNSMLYYLNNITIQLDKEYYNNKLGSDIFDKE